jgi:hypothetical protein
MRNAAFSPAFDNLLQSRGAAHTLDGITAALLRGALEPTPTT